MKRLLGILLLMMMALSLMAHPWKPSHFVIVDTDGGLDDMKAICMLLASPDVRVMAITITEGFRSEDDTYTRIRSMLDDFHHEGVVVVRSKEASKVIENVINNESSPVVFLALGSLKIIKDNINTIPGFRKKIRQIYWSNNGLPGTKGYNYNISPESATAVLADSIPVMVAGGGGDAFYDDKTVAGIASVNTRYARKVSEIIKANAGHPYVYTSFDEMVPLYLHYPSLFTTTSGGKNKACMPADIPALRNAALKILSGATVKKMQVMKAMTADTSFYMPDIQPFVTEIINRYGEDEWTSGVIADELHRHLGVFAIIGVKMGIRAREYFCTGVDEFHVTSNAGNNPPLSCMNDGLQVSTGATPGHGLLNVSNEEPFTPSADFTYKGITIKVTLKKEYAEKLLSELKEINFVYGLDSNIYWELVRKNTIKYWLQFDRNNIFDIVRVN
jgi:formylmethanofuran dehydrogenase subunit E